MTPRSAVLAALAGLIALAPTTAALYMLATRDTTPEGEGGRYQLFAQERPWVLLDTATGQTYQLARGTLQDEWRSSSASVRFSEIAQESRTRRMIEEIDAKAAAKQGLRPATQSPQVVDDDFGGVPAGAPGRRPATAPGPRQPDGVAPPAWARPLAPPTPR